MNINTQLLGLIKDMSQEQQALLCVFLNCSGAEVSKKLKLQKTLNEFNRTREKKLDCMLALIFESLENGVSPDVVFNALYPVYSLMSTPAKHTET